MKRYVVLFFILIMLLSSMVVFAQNQQKNAGKLTGKKIVMIIASLSFHGTEFEECKEIFDRKGAKIIVASSTLADANSGSFPQMTVKPNILIHDVQVKDYDAVVFIGGFGCTEYFDNPIAHKIARQALEQWKILAAIELAPTILANAGLLNGKKATASRSYILKQRGAIYTGKHIERDGNIITGSGPNAATEFGEAIASALSEK
jgi:protease I